MDTREMTGARRSYQVVEIGEYKLRQQLEVIFDGSNRPLFYLETRNGVFASNDSELVAEQPAAPRDAQPSRLEGDACESIALGFTVFLGRLKMQERLVMAGGWPSGTDDFPQLEGWCLEASCPGRGIILVQIRPAWWS